MPNPYSGRFGLSDRIDYKVLTPRQAMEADRKAMESDWRRIGGDMREAVKKVKEEEQRR